MTFWFTARLSRGEPVEMVAPVAGMVGARAHLRSRHPNARILLAEDNTINREAAVALLTSAGLTVDTAENGREGSRTG